MIYTYKLATYFWNNKFKSLEVNTSQMPLVSFESDPVISL